MKYEITIVSENVSILGVTFADEGVELTEHITVDDDEQKAIDYLPFFEKDCRRNYADKFPQPEQPGGQGMLGGIE